MRVAVLLLSCLLVLPAGAQPPTATLSMALPTGTAPVGGAHTGRLTLSEPAPEGGLTVSLSSSTPAAVVPGRVVIPAGSTEAPFSIQPGWVTAATTVKIVASAVGRPYLSTSGTLTLPPSGVTFLTFDPPNVVGGGRSVGTVSLTAPAPTAGITVQLGIVDPATPSPPCSPLPTMPATVKIPGGSHRATFPITTSPTWHETFEIAATFGETSASAPLRVTKPWLKEINVSERVKAGTPAQVVVSLAGPALPANCGIKYRMVSSDPHMAQVPADITFPAGASEAAFTMTTNKVPTPFGLTLTVTAFYFYTEDAYAESKQVRIALTPW